MFVIYVITTVIGFIIYTVVKIKIEEWLEESIMSRLSLKKPKLVDGGMQCKSLYTTSPTSEIEISSDESDASHIHDTTENDKESIASSILNNDQNENTLSVFQQSTDSSQSDEDTTNPLFTTDMNPHTSMFNWRQQKTSSNKDDFISVPDSSNDSDKKSTHFRNKGGMKKLNSFFINKPTNKNTSSKEKEDDLPEVGIQHEQMISGIKVKLPVKPYPCQIAVMNKLIQGCAKKENCLLESPTGSGKTLALLCGVLAWHDHYTAEIKKQINTATFHEGECERKNLPDEQEKRYFDNFSKKYTLDYDDEDYEEFDKIPKIPKIYYGTRTHKQIEQVIRELKTTCYRHKKMTILSSREFTCIQQSDRNKTELCNDLLDPTKHLGCPFYKDNNKSAFSSHTMIEHRGLGAIWDIEELVNIGKEEGLCPYFGARNLMETADIIFCPYNYIIDPDIRESMQLNLKDQVIILDEAHNIEDICRDVASVNFREDQLVTAAEECESLVKQRRADSLMYSTIAQYIRKLVEFLKGIGLDKIQDSRTEDLSSPYWTGAELLELFNMHGLNDLVTFLAACKVAIADLNKAKEDIKMQKSVLPVISPSTKIILEHLMFAIRMIESEEFRNDYRACVVENLVKDFKYASDNTWLSVNKRQQRARTLKLICMNPGVIFAPLAANARSIILASGTLTPTTSFQSELRTVFAHVLNTAHVIPKEQIFATSVSRGPKGIQLRANYQNVNSWAFQDELGRVLLDICETVPHGILCFFSSYHMMHTQIERWKNNDTWDKIISVKEVFIEPRYGGDLTTIMREYREVIEQTSGTSDGDITGALFLAVFRGKVAEGIDFRDNEARCVVTVGIPYAVRKDPVIDMKLKYNDKNVSKGLLTGSNWYSIQAFRALNQALGRCLRHIHDWGAVLLVDERFLQPDNRENLPKWVKMVWIHQNRYNLKQQLSDFVGRQKLRESVNVTP